MAWNRYISRVWGLCLWAGLKGVVCSGSVVMGRQLWPRAPLIRGIWTFSPSHILSVVSFLVQDVRRKICGAMRYAYCTLRTWHLGGDILFLPFSGV